MLVLGFRALERNDYNHVTATYYLLAERKLRAHRQEEARASGAGGVRSGPPHSLTPIPTSVSSHSFNTSTGSSAHSIFFLTMLVQLQILKYLILLSFEIAAAYQLVGRFETEFTSVFHAYTYTFCC